MWRSEGVRPCMIPVTAIHNGALTMSSKHSELEATLDHHHEQELPLVIAYLDLAARYSPIWAGIPQRLRPAHYPNPGHRLRRDCSIPLDRPAPLDELLPFLWIYLGSSSYPAQAIYDVPVHGYHGFAGDGYALTPAELILPGTTVWCCAGQDFGVNSTFYKKA